MTFIRRISLACEAKDCAEVVALTADTETIVLRAARLRTMASQRHGWTRSKVGADLCPKHSPKRV